MAKFNTATTRPAAGRGFIVTDTRATARTHEGAPGYARDNKSELFLLAVANFVNEQSFYESAADRDSRFASLTRAVAVTDPDWTRRFVHWLRRDGGLRSAPLVLAAEAVKARLEAGPQHWDRTNDAIIDAALNRADEPAEMLAYWTSRYGRNVPRAVRRGIARAAVRLYTQWSTVKWDTRDTTWRFGDVIELCHPDPLTWEPNADQDMDAEAIAARREELRTLYRYLLARRRNRDEPIPDRLFVLHANDTMWRIPLDERRRMLTEFPGLPGMLRRAAMTWENLATWTQQPLNGAAWDAIAPTAMGYMALIRNLRAMVRAGASSATLDTVAARLADPDEVRQSRILPMQILSAYRATSDSTRFAWPLEQALDASLDNIPRLDGHTLILVDTSLSMNDPFSKDGTLMRWDAAVLFGLALARRAQRADVVSFATDSREFTLRPGESLLPMVGRWKRDGYFFGGGTYTAEALRRHYRGHDQVVVLTDEQAAVRSHQQTVDAAIPSSTLMVTWNLAGYKHGHTPGERNRVTFAGLSDKSFALLPLIKRGLHADWPF